MYLILTLLDATNINEIRLSANRLTHLHSGVFKGLNNLEFLLLDQNDIRAASSDWFSLNTNLLSLKLSSNKLDKAIKPGSDQFSKLRKLEVENNFIETLNKENFLGLNRLE